jgi:TPP-dependent indolepyruvate ferredoxin oxidoreductase alpha subunit
MKLNDNIETKETEGARGAVAKVEVEKTTAKPVLAKKAAVESIAVTKENLEKLIPQWKAQYGNVFKNTLEDDSFVIWRSIKRGEYKSLLNAEKEIDILTKQEAISKIAILYPANVDELIDSRAGLATVLSEEILRLSGFEISETKSL